MPIEGDTVSLAHSRTHGHYPGALMARNAIAFDTGHCTNVTEGHSVLGLSMYTETSRVASLISVKTSHAHI